DPLQEFRGTLATRYIVQRKLGSGVMSNVFLAEDARYGRQVAIKVLKPEFVQAVAAERFMREIRVTAQLDHPHCLPLLDSGQTDAYVLIARWREQQGDYRRALAAVRRRNTAAWVSQYTAM